MPVTAEWRADYPILLGTSLLLALTLPLVRNRVPTTVGFVVRALIYLLVSFPQGTVIDIRFLLLASLFIDLAAHLRPRISIAACCVLTALFLFVRRPLVAFGTSLEEPGLLESLASLLVALVLAASVILLRIAVNRLSRERERNARLNSSVLQLTSANTEFLQHASVVERESAVNERNRITRELHDVIGQTLTNIIMMMDAAMHRGQGSPEESLKLHQWTREQARAGLESTRAALYELRAIPEVRLKGIKAIKKLVDTFASLTHVAISVEWGNMPWELDPVTDVTVYRIVQESLSNSFSHGMATHVSIHFLVDQGCLHLSIRDDGRGAIEGKKGIGQSGMEERVANLQGAIAFSNEESGYLVTARIPIEEGVGGEAR